MLVHTFITLHNQERRRQTDWPITWPSSGPVNNIFAIMACHRNPRWYYWPSVLQGYQIGGLAAQISSNGAKLWILWWLSHHQSCGITVMFIRFPSDGLVERSQVHESSHQGPPKMAAIWQMTFSNSFFVWKIVLFWFEFHWNLFSGRQLTMCQCGFWYWLGTDHVTSHYLN